MNCCFSTRCANFLGKVVDRSAFSIFLVLCDTLPCSRLVRIQLIWKKNRDLLAQSIQDSPNGTDSQYRLNSVHCGPIDAASQLTERESYSFIMKMITRKDVPQYTLRWLRYAKVPDALAGFSRRIFDMYNTGTASQSRDNWGTHRAIEFNGWLDY